MNCQEVKEKLSYYLEGDLPEGAKFAIRQHLAGCSSCHEELESLSKIIGAVKSLPEIEPPTGFSSRVMARISEEERKKVESAKGFSLLGFRGFVYGFIVLVVGGIIYYIFQTEKPIPVQLAQTSPPVVQEAAKPPMSDNKEKTTPTAPEMDRVAPSFAPKVISKTAPPPVSILTTKPASNAVEAKSEPIQLLNQPALRSKKNEALQPKVEENNSKMMAGADSAKEENLSEQSYAPAPDAPEAPPAIQSAERSTIAGGMTASNEMTALEIMKNKSEAYMANDQSSTVKLHLFTKEGDEKKIVTKRYWKNYAGKEGMATKTIFFTEFPPDAKGTGFLIWNYSQVGKPDDLWLYLPSLRQTRHISSRGQDDAFMGSDLTFGDMGQRRLEEDDHQLLNEEPCGDEVCYVVESVAKDKEGVYSKKIHWITKKDFIEMKIKYYDRKGDLLKTQKIHWQEVSGYKAWKSSEVINVQTQHKTIFEISDLKINSGLKDDIFKERTLTTGIQN